MSLLLDIEGKDPIVVVDGQVVITATRQVCTKCGDVMVEHTAAPETRIEAVKEDAAKAAAELAPGVEVNHPAYVEQITHCGYCGSDNVVRNIGNTGFWTSVGTVKIDNAVWYNCANCHKTTPDWSTRAEIGRFVENQVAEDAERDRHVKGSPKSQPEPVVELELPERPSPSSKDAPTESFTCWVCGGLAQIALNDAGDGHALGGVCSWECLRRMATQQRRPLPGPETATVIEADDEGGAV